MILMYFTERPYRYVPEDEVIKHGGFFGLPNKFFDAEKGAQLFDEYLNEAAFAEEAGFDAIMLNEHHGTPFCLGAVMNVEARFSPALPKRCGSCSSAIRCLPSRIRSGWPKNWRRLTAFRMAGSSPVGCAARAASRSSIMPTQRTTASCSMRPTI